MSIILIQFSDIFNSIVNWVCCYFLCYMFWLYSPNFHSKYLFSHSFYLHFFVHFFFSSFYLFLLIFLSFLVIPFSIGFLFLPTLVLIIIFICYIVKQSQVFVFRSFPGKWNRTSAAMFTQLSSPCVKPTQATLEAHTHPHARIHAVHIQFYI